MGEASTNTAKLRKIGIIGGTSLLASQLFCDLSPKTISTDYGDVVLYVDNTRDTDSSGVSIVFLQRHCAEAPLDGKKQPQYRPPHRINTRANISALKKEGVDVVLAVCSVGSLGVESDVGKLIVPDDYSMLFCGSVSLYDDDRGHIVPSLDAELRRRILKGICGVGLDGIVRDGGIYLQTPGPRFETRAEVKILKDMGDVIGMTAGSEATMAKEAGLKYAMMCMVDNMANGLAEKELSSKEFHESVKKHQAVVEKAAKSVLDELEKCVE
eukprot:Plantae.Rhodophyta-Hildenbrandia_rubra.ctg11104.p1 GENE.Plantae.Rhodophyta-Hildenbrandia_rubra.ctg11104~~Plantae.Rhodophyta-Hildenbrandia_rubra.ctg11104.p1  ORF type:complete len:269 (-),score=70.39 Plantae.Rhodophyta-Hildenbrandia_rubra.ctg11104:520-1326(-)